MANDEAELSTSSGSLEFTPTWAVASVCFVLIALSLLIEHGLHLLAKYFKKQRRKSLIQTLDKIKSDLMLLGFISLFLTICQKPIANICIPRSVGETFLPCETMTSDEEEESKCEEQGKLSFLSRKGVQELQLLIFVLAFFHVFSSFLTFSLGIAKNGDPRVPVCGHGVRIRAVDLGNQRFRFHLRNGRLRSTKYCDEIRTDKYISDCSDAAHQMKSWEYWEAETRTLEYEFSNDPRRFKLIHQTSFGRRHLQFWSEHRYLRLPACFLRQFYRSVSKVDYFTLRHGFIMAHFAEGSNFDFQKYLRRALEKDFGVVVGVSFWIWTFSVIFIFLNAHVFYNYFWLPFIPLAMLLIVGTKLQGIITRMCVDTNDKSHVVRGTLLVRPSDHYFWFGRPKLLLHLMHFILFQNSFQLAFFTWTGFKFGIRSCFHNKTEDIVIKLVMGLLVHILCGYVTLPLYALVTQMGTSMRKAVFTEGVVEGLKRWRVKAKKKVALRNNSARRSLDASVTSLDTSPSFSTLDGVSFHIERVYPSGDTSYLAVEVGEDDSVTGDRTEHHQKLGSFEGFELSKTP